MRTFELKIELGNSVLAGEVSGNEVARILREMADRVDASNIQNLFEDQFQPTWPLRDANGNKVGVAFLEDTEAHWWLAKNVAEGLWLL